MNVLLLEDEALASDRLEKMILSIDETIRICGRVKSVEAGIEWFASNAMPDLIFSDIQLLDGTSFEIFEQVHIPSPVIFTTAFDQYAIKAFEVNSVDYLLKPIQADKLVTAIQKVKNKNATVAPPVDFTSLVKLLQHGKSSYKSRFMIRLGQKIIALPVEKIAYFFSENKLTYVITPDQKKYPMDQTLDELIELLDPAVFFRANRQFIITFTSISEIHPYFKGRIKLVLTPLPEEEVVVSSERTPAFKKWIDQ